MKFCEKCGKELPDDAGICIGCGCEVKIVNDPIAAELSAPAKKKTKSKKLWFILGAVVLILGVVAAILFVPRDLKMKDIQEVNVVSAIIRYGLPEGSTTTDDGIILKYEDKVDFYGITPWAFSVYPEENMVVFFFHAEDGDEVYRKIARYCDLEKTIGGMFHKFSYENLTITTYDYDGSYVSIEID